MTRLTASVAFVLAVTALGAAPPTTGAAGGRPLGCGDTVTTDTRLTANLVDCPRDGLVIGADGITLDLDGHRVDGDAAGGGVGIDIGGHRGVTIENGTVREFEEGVFVLGGSEIAIRRVTSTGERHGGILVDGGRGVSITDNAVRRSGAGIIVTRSDDVSVRANRVSGSAFGGIPVFESQHVVVAGNTVTTSRTDTGIGLFRGSSHSAVLRNRVSQSGAGIVAAEGAYENLIGGNTVRRNGSGIVVDVGTQDNRVVDNVVEASAFEGIAVVGSDRNLIARNRVVRNGSVDAAGGIVVIPLPDDLAETSDANVLVDNAVLGNDGDGLRVGEGQRRNILRGNRADHNSRLGIDAATGTIDGGGNTAAQNGDPRQCVGVVCQASDGRVRGHLTSPT
jgi:parallel beta-helix repeat protein